MTHESNKIPGFGPNNFCRHLSLSYLRLTRFLHTKLTIKIIQSIFVFKLSQGFGSDGFRRCLLFILYLFTIIFRT